MLEMIKTESSGLFVYRGIFAAINSSVESDGGRGRFAVGEEVFRPAAKSRRLRIGQQRWFFGSHICQLDVVEVVILLLFLRISIFTVVVSALASHAFVYEETDPSQIRRHGNDNSNDAKIIDIVRHAVDIVGDSQHFWKLLHQRIHSHTRHFGKLADPAVIISNPKSVLLRSQKRNNNHTTQLKNLRMKI